MNLQELKQLVAKCEPLPWPVAGHELEHIARIVNALPALIEAAEALQAIINLDDGDKPDLWHFEKEFNSGRAALAKLEGLP